jgi:KDEL-tailed cysteine endopeptidase
MDNKGIGSEASYPYTAVNGTCQSVPSVANITGYTDVAVNSELALETAIVQQPVSVAVEADPQSWSFYASGVMTAAYGTALDHGVLAVGYGTLDGQHYYKV